MSEICTNAVTCENKEQWTIAEIFNSVIYINVEGCYGINTVNCCTDD